MCADLSASGEEIIFGSAGGYLHLWALSAEPRVSQLSQPLEQVPRLASPPTAALGEADSFALAAVYPSEQVLVAMLCWITLYSFPQGTYSTACIRQAAD